MIADEAAGGGHGAVRWAERLERVVDVIGRAGAWTILALVLVMSGNVLLRYGFSMGSVWAQELEWHLLVPICLIGMSFALLHGGHVRVDVFYANYRPGLKAVIDLTGALCFVLIAGLIIWLSLRYVGQSFANAEGSANPGGIPYRWALKAFIPLGFGLFLLQSLAEALRAYARLRQP
jgi:TRAP-type mannitol/chloroaromatic compound transport system permease small subunit